MQRSINDFFIGKSAKKRHNETESTNEDKNGDNSDIQNYKFDLKFYCFNTYCIIQSLVWYLIYFFIISYKGKCGCQYFILLTLKKKIHGHRGPGFF